MHMRHIHRILLAFFLITLLSAVTFNNRTKAIRILLMGDSTTEGGSPIFENTVEQLLKEADNLTPVEVINVGKGGETAFSLMESGRYDREIKNIESIDYIFFRYGINDWLKRKPFDKKFPDDMKNVLEQLKKDFPEAKIHVMTIIPFLKMEDTRIVNDYITNIAKEQGLELFDIYPAYEKKIDELDKNAMTVRFYPLKGVPQNYHKLVEPFTSYVPWKKTEMVRLQTNEFDAVLGHLTGWYNDKHPNNTGYRFIADETVKYLLPKLKSTGSID